MGTWWYLVSETLNIFLDMREQGEGNRSEKEMAWSCRVNSARDELPVGLLASLKMLFSAESAS